MVDYVVNEAKKAGAVTEAFKIIREELGKELYVLVYPDDIFKYLPIIKEYFLSDNTIRNTGAKN